MAGLGPVDLGGAGDEALEAPPPMPRDPVPVPTGVTDRAPSREVRSAPSRDPVSVSSGESGPLWELADWEVAGEPGMPMLSGPRGDSILLSRSEKEDSGRPG